MSVRPVVDLPVLCVATGPAVGGISVAVLPELVDGRLVWWHASQGGPTGWGPSARSLAVDVVLSRRPFVFDDAEGRGPTALIPLTLESYGRLVRPRLGGPVFHDAAALESWFLGRYQLTA